ncbi:hypothetical protein [Streptomyces barkulensis]|uniref:hypothetical protein n=1 Tax=Streptomyces barkulensis TaxID=1257026 RepID=UPI000C6E0E25|nr:hypothetical protein [Streptomyces barkulensis]
MPVLPVRPSRRPRSERERLAQELLDRATPVMSALGVLFLLLVLGERPARPGAFPKVLETALAVYPVAVFATLAGSLGAYLLESRATGDHRAEVGSGGGEDSWS